MDTFAQIFSDCIAVTIIENAEFVLLVDLGVLDQCDLLSGWSNCGQYRHHLRSNGNQVLTQLSKNAGNYVVVCPRIYDASFSFSSTDWYQYRADHDNKNYDIWLNKEHYLQRDGKSEDIPTTETTLRVYVKFRSPVDGYRYRILCPNQWYWPEDTTKGNTFYVALYGAKERFQQEPPMEYVDPSKICLYQSLINPGNLFHTKSWYPSVPNIVLDDEKIVESRNPQSPNGLRKKMCCTDQPLTNYPGSDLAAVKLKPDAEFGEESPCTAFVQMLIFV